jgi:hypothetical protein
VTEERLQPGGGLAAYPGDEPGGDPDPGQVAHQLRGPGDRHVVGTGQARSLGVHLRPVLGPGGDPRGRRPGGDRPAAPALRACTWFPLFDPWQ